MISTRAETYKDKEVTQKNECSYAENSNQFESPQRLLSLLQYCAGYVAYCSKIESGSLLESLSD